MKKNEKYTADNHLQGMCYYLLTTIHFNNIF